MRKRCRPLILLLWPVFFKVFSKWLPDARTKKGASERSTSERQINSKSFKNSFEICAKSRFHASSFQRADQQDKIERKTVPNPRNIGPGTPRERPRRPPERSERWVRAINIKVGASEQDRALPDRLAAQFRRPESPKPPKHDQVI